MAGIFGYFLRPQVTPYVLLFIERDGSTYLTSLLANHPDIQAIYERFAVLKQQGQSAEAQLGWAKRYLAPPIISRCAAVGFKTKLVDVLDLDGFANLLQHGRCRIIHMQRRNRVKAVVSRINAKRLHDASGNWNLYRVEDRMPPAAINAGQFAEYLREREEAEAALDAFVRRLELRTVKIVYEDLLTDREASLNKVFTLLGVRSLPLEAKTLKHNSDDLRQVLFNFDELRAGYRGTTYEAMFDEILVQDVTSTGSQRPA